jgi:uncharacterized protein YjbI with pentapeptide repeats
MAVCGTARGALGARSALLIAERRIWCTGKLDDAGCTQRFAELETDFDAAWREEWFVTLGSIPEVALAGRDLRNADLGVSWLVHADLRGARLQGANLNSSSLQGAALGDAQLDRARLAYADLRDAILGFARLRGADLEQAELEEANLSGARLEGANLSGAHLNGANLALARLEEADLSGARMVKADVDFAHLVGADLSSAQMEEADLRGVWLERADLGWARVKEADLSGARFVGTNLRGADLRGSYWAGASRSTSPIHFADFRGARGLRQAQLDDMIGDADTLLPDGSSDTGEPWYVWSCWETPPPNIEAIIATAAAPFASDADRATLRAEFLCGPGNPRIKTGTPFPVDAPYPEGHPLADRVNED